MWDHLFSRITKWVQHGSNLACRITRIAASPTSIQEGNESQSMERSGTSRAGTRQGLMSIWACRPAGACLQGDTQALPLLFPPEARLSPHSPLATILMSFLWADPPGGSVPLWLYINFLSDSAACNNCCLNCPHDQGIGWGRVVSVMPGGGSGR